MPAARPRSDARTPDDHAPRRATEAVTCRRLAPIARSNAISRVRWATTIENVLKMMNEPTNSAMPAKMNSGSVMNDSASWMSFWSSSVISLAGEHLELAVVERAADATAQRPPARSPASPTTAMASNSSSAPAISRWASSCREERDRRARRGCRRRRTWRCRRARTPWAALWVRTCDPVADLEAGLVGRALVDARPRRRSAGGRAARLESPRVELVDLGPVEAERRRALIRGCRWRRRPCRRSGRRTGGRPRPASTPSTPSISRSRSAGIRDRCSGRNRSSSESALRMYASVPSLTSAKRSSNVLRDGVGEHQRPRHERHAEQRPRAR